MGVPVIVCCWRLSGYMLSISGCVAALFHIGPCNASYFRVFPHYIWQSYGTKAWPRNYADICTLWSPNWPRNYAALQNFVCIQNGHSMVWFFPECLVCPMPTSRPGFSKLCSSQIQNWNQIKPHSIKQNGCSFRTQYCLFREVILSVARFLQNRHILNANTTWPCWCIHFCGIILLKHEIAPTRCIQFLPVSNTLSNG